jgi:hypothetical protein
MSKVLSVVYSNNMSFVSVNEEEDKKLHQVYYQDKNFFGTKRLSDAYKLKFPNEMPPSQRAIGDWLSRQGVNNKFRRPEKRSSVKPFHVQKRGMLAIDLIDMSSHIDRGYLAMLTGVDCYTRFGYAVPLRAKTAVAVREGFKLFKHQNPRIRVSAILSDNGKEFTAEFAEYLDAKGIKKIPIPAHSPWQNIDERFNQTLSRLVFKNMDVIGNQRWVQDLPKLLFNYNSTISVTTKKSPIDLERATPEENTLTAEAINNRLSKTWKKRVTGTDIQVGDKVRIVDLSNLQSRIFKPSRAGYFKEEIFTVKAIKASDYVNRLPTYKIVDRSGKEQAGTWSRWQLLKVNENVPEEQDEDEDEEDDDDEPPRESLRRQGEYEVEEILQHRKVRGKIQYLVHWAGYDDPNDHTWESTSNLKNAKHAITEYKRLTKRLP